MQAQRQPDNTSVRCKNGRAFKDGDMDETQSDRIACRCNVCDDIIEFQRQSEGQRITCPIGMETVLYIPTLPVKVPPVIRDPMLKSIPCQIAPLGVD